MEPRRYLRCLGQPSLLAPTGEPVRFRTKKHLALLIYLAVDAKTHQRERLAELFWPRVSRTEARHSLATALTILRPRVGPGGLETSRDHVRLVPERIDLDLQRLEAGDVLGSEVTDALEVAGFLDGFDIPDSLEFTHWKDRQQAKFLPMIKDALVILIDRCRRTGDSRQIERLADRMLALDELSEDAIRAKMEARAFAGDRLTALEFYEAWRTKLADELQAVPSELVEGMAVRLRRRGWERTTMTNIPTVPTDQWRGRPFIGRTAEYRVLYEAWEAVKRGEPGHALVLGDSGVGKTTLVERLTTAAGLEGAAISRVQCYDLEREIPYSTVSSLILGLLERPGASATSPQALAELSRTVPAVRHRFPTIPVASDSQGESARIRLTEAFHELLTTIAEEHPVILVVDDLHYADDVSLAVLHLVMRRARQQSIMVVLLARPGELPQSAQATGLRAAGATLGMREIEVTPLAEEESSELLTSLIPTDEPQPTATVRRALLRAGAGYPMVIELLVQDWQTNGEQSLALSVDAMIEDFAIGKRPETPYRKILERITKSLDSTTHSVMNLAAILGHRLNDFSMYAIVDLSAGQTMSSMAELVQRRVLRDGTHGLEFVNEMVRAAAYVGVPVTLRRALHSKIADRLIMEYERGMENLGLEIAWHCIRAERRPQATAHLLRGAREAIRSGAPHAAERGLSTAFSHLHNSERDEATLLLAETLQEQGRWLDSLDVLREAQLQRPSDLGLILRIVAEASTSVPNTENSMNSVGRLQAIIERSSDAHVRIKAASAAAMILSNVRDVERAQQLLRRVAQIPTTHLDVDDVTTLAESKARLLYSALNHGSSLDEIVQITGSLRDTRQVNSKIASLHTGLGAIACSQGKYLDARDEFRRAHDICVRLGNDTGRSNQAGQIALCCFRLGEYSDAVEWSVRALEPSGVQFTGYVECQAAQYSGCSYALQGDYNRSKEAIDRLDSRILSTVPAWLRQAWLLAKADILLFMEQRSDAVTVGREAIGDSHPVLHSSFFAGAFARWLALTSVGTRSESKARDQIKRMADDLETFDAIDQVEVLCAANMVGGDLGGGPHSSSSLILRKLEHLPAAISQQLRRLGAL